MKKSINLPVMKKALLFILISIRFTIVFGQLSDSVQTPNGYLHYHLYGKGKPVLMLSGGPGASAFMLEPIANHLSNEFQSILFEQRGTGKSIPVPFDSTTINLLQAMEDINLLKSRLGVKKLSLIGHSYGAMLAARYAIAYPQHVDKLVLVGLASDPYGGDNRSARASVEE